MQCPNSTDDEINAAIDSILEEDQLQCRPKTSQLQYFAPSNDEGRDYIIGEACLKSLGELNVSQEESRSCGNRGVNRSLRFTLRVTEALRALQRRRQEPSMQCSTTAEIVDYIGRNFKHDGDLDAQVRTALNRTVSQGFVKKEGNDLYRLIGPFACLTVNTEKRQRRCNATPKATRRKRKPSCGSKSCVNQDDSSEDDLSIPTSAEEDILRNQKVQDIGRMQRKNNDSRQGCRQPVRCPKTPPTPRRGCSSPVRCPQTPPTPRRGCSSPLTRNQNQNCGSTPRKRRSSACRVNESVGAISNPIEDFEVGVNLADFEDDDYGEESTVNESCESNDHDGGTEEDENDELDSNDSVLDDLRRRGRGRGREPEANPEARERELKRWIKNCRRECARRAAAENPVN